MNLRRKWPAPTLFLIALAFSLITLTPHFLSVLAANYILSAPVAVLTGRFRRRRPRADEPDSEDEEPDDTSEAARS
jgi:hypothetical protein